MLARMTVRSCENVRAEQLGKATLPGMLRCLIPSALTLALSRREREIAEVREGTMVGKTI
ncbi:MAG: hypothetical protein KGZ41_06845 [Dethiobacter sp.]|nr:hypothetical protein [Dethiobacter sp.]MBS3900266.1 hypothetical protein [Dethiobacter sp.]MBS3983502.1 hypothetical protein [Dethiobacter sp.]